MAEKKIILELTEEEGRVLWRALDMERTQNHLESDRHVPETCAAIHDKLHVAARAAGIGLPGVSVPAREPVN
jgi:hypothetical protein